MTVDTMYTTQCCVGPQPGREVITTESIEITSPGYEDEQYLVYIMCSFASGKQAHLLGNQSDNVTCSYTHGISSLRISFHVVPEHKSNLPYIILNAGEILANI